MITKMQSGVSRKPTTSTTDDALRQLAFDNSFRANIIFVARSGKIIMANRTACKLLGYSKRELLTKTRSAIFDINDTSFKKMLEEKTLEGESEGLVTVIKKSGKQLSCLITSAVFTGSDGIEKSITTIADMSQSILKQKGIDTIKEKIVADNIVLAKSKQKKIDIKKEKIVADNIALVKSRQKNIDRRKEKIVADNIVLAKSKQNRIDKKREKIVDGNIILAQAKSDNRQIENNEWIKYIAKTSYDVMWDWDVASGQIYVGDSIEETFGYKVQNNIVNFADFKGCLLPEDKEPVEKKLLKALSSSSKSWDDTYTLKRFDGSLASTTSRASIVRDENGKAVHLIGNTQDVTILQELEKKLKGQKNIRSENNDIFELAAKLSYDGIWDWNLLTNEFFLGEGFEEIFGDALNDKGKMSSDWSSHLHPDDKGAVEKGMGDAIASSATYWEQAYRFVKTDDSIANVFCKANIIRDISGKALRMIGVVHDLSRQEKLEKKLHHKIAIQEKLLTEYKESFKVILNSSSDIFYDSDLVNNEVIISDAYEKEFGYKIRKNMIPSEDWVKHIHPDDKEAVLQDYLRMLKSGDIQWKYNYRFLRADGSVTNVVSSGIVLRDAGGKAYRMIGYMRDMSKQTVIEKKLEHEIKLKEIQIEEATREAKENERSEIGKELHDNVNQLLGASKLYLDLAKHGGEHSEMYFTRSSEYTLTAIEEIRKLTKGLTTDFIKNLGLCESIDNITRDTMEINLIKISCALDSFKEDSVNNKFKLNVFRVVQEQLNNIIKYAKATEVEINLLQNKKSIMLTITDNGIGFDTTRQYQGIGIGNIKSRVASYNGTADFVSHAGQGCILKIKFPLSALISK